MSPGPGDPSSDAADVPLDAVDAVLARAAEDAERFRRLADEVGALRVTRATPRGEVEATVDGDGRLVDVRFDARFREVEPGALAMMVLSCVRRAQAGLADRVAERVAELAPDGAAGRAVVDGYRQRFPPIADDAAARARPRPPGTWWR